MEVAGNLFYAKCATTETTQGEWYIDSGCSNHMTGNVDLLVDVRTNVAGKMQMPTGALVNMAGMGSLVIDIAKGRKYIREVIRLDDVLAQCNPCIIEPEKYVEASQDSSWLKAMEDELHMIEKNGTWELVDRPTGKPVIGVKWVCKTKLNLDGSFQKNKARIVATVYAQKSGLDYNETYALVANWTSLELSLL
ncbi:hypothetical protein L3X38_036713 [Prunus dulcis]|uniref:Reverse transcriptase Ty1/copia-type domain-containing protein n=1 Tax=Prunus dulcis TaxID=3755 RepID=A0AAD4V3A4_PRUDU|nr:hypothetical protein L3X38_036713 [Prunus dulcis]